MLSSNRGQVDIFNFVLILPRRYINLLIDGTTRIVFNAILDGMSYSRRTNHQVAKLDQVIFWKTFHAPIYELFFCHNENFN